MNFPPLTVGRVYERAEVEPFISRQDGTSDFDLVGADFPRDIETWRADLMLWRPQEPMLIQYQPLPTRTFMAQILDLEQIYAGHRHQLERVEILEKLFLAGEVVFPVFIQRNDPERRIIEGMHRLLAISRLGWLELPVFATGYRDWFDR